MVVSRETQRRWLSGAGEHPAPTDPARAKASGSAEASNELTNRHRPGHGGGRAQSIAVIDVFDGPGSHGEQVAFVLDQQTRATQADIRKLNMVIPFSDATTFKGQVEEFVAGLVNQSSDMVEAIVNDPRNRIRTINESLGTSPARVAVETWVGAETPEQRVQIARDLGLPDNTPPRQVLQTLMNEMDKLFDSSPKILAAQKRFEEVSQRANDRGIIHMVAAGNEGDYLRQLGELGLTFDKNFAVNVLLNEKVVTVAASEGDGDKMAPFTSPNPFTDVSADGTAVPVDANGTVADGTSFASPTVAGIVAEMRIVNPRLSVNQIRDILTRASTDTPAPREIDGAGILDGALAIQMARDAGRRPRPVAAAAETSNDWLKNQS